MSTENDDSISLHDVYRSNSACGYSRDLSLTASEIQAITARLRGISAISAIQIAASSDEEVKLGAWMRSGLDEAIHALAEDAHAVLEFNNERLKKNGGGEQMTAEEHAAREEVALLATYEIDAIAMHLRSNLPTEIEYGHLRCMVLRVLELNSIAMSVLGGDDARELKEMRGLVEGTA